MTYADAWYISVARTSAVRHHEHSMEKLRAKIAHLTKAMAWELEQHQSRLKELQQAEDTLAMDHSPTPSMGIQPTGEPTPSSRRRRTKSRKSVHSSEQQPVAQLVG